MLRVNLPYLKEGLPSSCFTCKHVIEKDCSLIVCQYTGAVVEDEEYEKRRHPCCPLERLPKETV